jgi:hypothetical protein
VWGSALDEETGQTYYFHVETDEVVWERPQELVNGVWEVLEDERTGRVYL